MRASLRVVAVALVLALGVAGCEVPRGENGAALETHAGAMIVWTPRSGAGVPLILTVRDEGPSGGLARWEVRQGSSLDAEGDVLVVAENPHHGGEYSLALLEEPAFSDGLVSVSVLALSGEEDPGGGIVFRDAGRGEYGLLRWNPHERNVRLYLVSDGVRQPLLTRHVAVDASRWHRLTVAIEGRRVRASIDGHALIDVEEKRIATQGRCGMWVKADSRSAFTGFDLVVKR